MDVSLFASATLCVVFGVAAVEKVRTLDDRVEFRAQLAAIGVRPRPVRLVLATAVPLAELIIAGLLIAGHVYRRVGLTAGVGLLALFTLVLLKQAWRKRSWSGTCGCFGSGPELPAPAHLASNLLLIVLAVLALQAAFDNGPNATGDEVLGTGLGALLGAVNVFGGAIYQAARGPSSTSPHVGVSPGRRS